MMSDITDHYNNSNKKKKKIIIIIIMIIIMPCFKQELTQMWVIQLQVTMS